MYKTQCRSLPLALPIYNRAVHLRMGTNSISHSASNTAQIAYNRSHSCMDSVQWLRSQPSKMTPLHALGMPCSLVVVAEKLGGRCAGLFWTGSLEVSTSNGRHGARCHRPRLKMVCLIFALDCWLGFDLGSCSCLPSPFDLGLPVGHRDDSRWCWPVVAHHCWRVGSDEDRLWTDAVWDALAADGAWIASCDLGCCDLGLPKHAFDRLMNQTAVGDDGRRRLLDRLKVGIGRWI